ncbi:hypothetical protein HYV87_01840 [Candidatus Woesearchaeota archaeon]|nr:hypothetical protein [Candidatus Woesearchaeota archaeon]
MVKNNLKYALVAGALTALSCTSPNTPETPDCSTVNLEEKAGFETVANPESSDPVCYKILSSGSRFVEYLAHCQPEPGNIECYREFSGPNKGEMQINYTSSFFGVPAYSAVFRNPSGKIWSPDLPEIPASAAEKFEACTKLFDMTVKIPKVCKELHDYKKKSD